MLLLCSFVLPALPLRSFVPPVFPSYLVAAVAAAPAGGGGSDGAGAAVAAAAAAAVASAPARLVVCWFVLVPTTRSHSIGPTLCSLALVWAHLSVSNTSLVHIIIEKLTFIIQIINLEKNN